MRLLPFVLLALLLLGGADCGTPETGPDADAAPRVVALGGSVAETVDALGAGPLLVGRDESAVYPDAVQALPSVGYYRQISAEGVLSLGPTLVLADPASGPEVALDQIAGAGVRVVRLPGGGSVEAAEAQIRAVAEALDRADAAEPLVEHLRAQLAAAERLAEAARAAGQPPPRALHVLGTSGGSLNLAGTGTNADAFLRLAGGVNAFGAVEGYRPMSAEALVQAAPEVIFLSARTAAMAGGGEAFAQRPEVRATPAGAAGRIVVLPDHVLLFGPSLGDEVRAFAERLHAPAVAVR